MSPLFVQIAYTVETSLLMSISTIAVYLSFRILRFPDLTSEGGFGLAATTSGIVLIHSGSAVLATLTGVLTGALTGTLTAILANKVRIPTMLASILTMTMCISAGLLIAGKPNQTLPSAWILQRFLPGIESPLVIGLTSLAAMITAIIFGLRALFHTGFGHLLRLRGENPALCVELKHSLLLWDIAGLALSNAFVGLAAVLLTQRAGYSSITMGRGTAIAAIAAIMLADALHPARRLEYALLGCAAGTLILQLIRLVALNLGVPDGGLDLLTSLVVIAFCWLAASNKSSHPSLLEKIRM